MTDKIKKGLLGENLAADFLMTKGYKILERNYRYKHSEIDLIAQLNDLLIFVEVKTRTSTIYGEPESFVKEKKIQKILEGANEYLVRIDWQKNIRFDVISIVLKNEDNPEITHFEDVHS